MQLVLTDRSDLTVGRDFAVASPSTWRLADLSTKYAFLNDFVGWGGMPLHMVEQDIAAGTLVVLDADDVVTCPNCYANVLDDIDAWWRKETLWLQPGDSPVASNIVRFGDIHAGRKFKTCTSHGRQWANLDGLSVPVVRPYNPLTFSSPSSAWLPSQALPFSAWPAHPFRPDPIKVAYQRKRSCYPDDPARFPASLPAREVPACGS